MWHPGFNLYEVWEVVQSTNRCSQSDGLTSPQPSYSVDPYPLLVERSVGAFCANLVLLRARWCWHTMSKVLDVDVAMESIMDAWFEQRHENRRQLAKTVETHRMIASGDQRLGFARLVRRKMASANDTPQDTINIRRAFYGATYSCLVLVVLITR